MPTTLSYCKIHVGVTEILWRFLHTYSDVEEYTATLFRNLLLDLLRLPEPPADQAYATGTLPARDGRLVPGVALWPAWGDALAQTSSKPRCTRCGGEGGCCTEYPERDVEHGGTWLLDTSGRVRITNAMLIMVPVGVWCYAKLFIQRQGSVLAG